MLKDRREVTVGVTLNAKAHLFVLRKGFLLEPHQAADNSTEIALRAVILRKYLQRVDHQFLRSFY
jgi:hypothetical protein